jgi:DNA-binding MarR family transcriptional regulator
MVHSVRMSVPEPADVGTQGYGADVDAVMAAARVLVAVSARSVAGVDDMVTLPQLRAMVMIAGRGDLNLGAVARGLGVHSSNATRLVERLVVAGLVDRRDDPADRRNLVLGLTVAGQRLLDEVMEHRRRAVTEILGRMPAARRRALVPVMRAFAQAGGENPDDAVWSLGWTTAS